MNTHRKTTKRNVAARAATFRVANWGLLVVALGQTACDEDPPPWDIQDAGFDASITANPGVEAGVTSELTSAATLASDVSTVDTEDAGEVITEDTLALDASVSPPVDLDASATTTSQSSSTASTSETTMTSSDVVTSETSGPNSETSDDATSGGQQTSSTGSDSSAPDVTSEASSEATSTAGTTLETGTDSASSGESSAGPTVVCGYSINEAAGLTLEVALANYTPPGASVDAGVWGDGGGPGDGGSAPLETDCYPPCIAALLAACPSTDACTPANEYTQACWSNGVSQTQEYIDGGETVTLIETAYLDDTPCITGRAVSDGLSQVYTWWDGAGNQVAHGVRESDDFTVTCENDQQDYAVNTSLCPELGEAVYDQFSCY